MDDLLQEFIAETRETLEALSGEIVAWESDPADRHRLDAIFRFVHTVKGSCGFLDLPRLARLSHAAEDVLAAVRDGARAPDTGLVNAVLAIVDRIGEIVEAIDAGAALDDSSEDLLIAALDEGAEAAGPKLTDIVQRAPTRSVRLAVDLLDRMMSGMSDMVLARNELARRLRDDTLDPAAEAALERLTMTVAEMRDTVTRTRMQKVDTLFSALPRMVRDTAASLGKSVTLVVEGADVELDRELIEMIRDPLVHVIRNAIDHGIETPAERKAAGKRENGRLSISARQSGNQVLIEVADDGRGIDTDQLLRRAIAKGRSEAELRAMSEAERIELIFEPGFTSKDEVTAISGRGVGMDVVRANIDQIGGRIALTNAPGRGLAITIRVPLTLSILSTIVVGVADHLFAVPRQAIEEIVSLSAEAVRIDPLGGARLATLRGERLPVVALCDALGVKTGTDAAMMVVVGVPGGRFALLVDRVLDAEELVIKPASPAVMAAGVYAGQTLPDNGRPMLLLDCVGLAARAGLKFGREAAALAEEPAVAEAEAVPALLFAALDGARRLVPLAAVDRIDTVAATAIRRGGGRLHLAANDEIVPVAANEAQLVLGGDVVVLRLSDGQSVLAYPVVEALDIVALPEEIAPAAASGEIAGVVLLDGEQIELVDTHWLFENIDRRETGAARPVVMLTGARAQWMRGFLAPMLVGAGYRVVTRLAKGQRADVVLTMDDGAPGAAGSAPLVRLRAEQAGDDGIYLYDRPALLAALAGAAR